MVYLLCKRFFFFTSRYLMRLSEQSWCHNLHQSLVKSVVFCDNIMCVICNRDCLLYTNIMLAYCCVFIYVLLLITCVYLGPYMFTYALYVSVCVGVSVCVCVCVHVKIIQCSNIALYINFLQSLLVIGQLSVNNNWYPKQKLHWTLLYLHH